LYGILPISPKAPSPVDKFMPTLVQDFVSET